MSPEEKIHVRFDVVGRFHQREVWKLRIEGGDSRTPLLDQSIAIDFQRTFQPLELHWWMLTNALGADIAPAPASSYDGETNSVHLSTLPSARFRPKRYRPDGQGFWSGHLPFAADLVGAL